MFNTKNNNDTNKSSAVANISEEALQKSAFEVDSAQKTPKTSIV